MKVRNLKANHSKLAEQGHLEEAVLASMKVRNLKANHSLKGIAIRFFKLY